MPHDPFDVLVKDSRTPHDRIREVLAATESRPATLEEFGRVVREMRKIANLFLGDVADMLDTSAAKLSDVELGKTPRPSRPGR